jgi:L-amino acid N-acyltransferase YncA
MAALIRFAATDDAEAVRDIYAPFCGVGSAVSFETVAPSVDEMRSRIVRTLEQFPYLVCERGDALAGYVYAGPYRERAAYQWSVEVTAYVHTAHRRTGVGRALYTALFALLRAQGYICAFAGITLPNPASVALHTTMRFEPVGIYKSVGFKCGAWQDVGWWRLLLRPLPENPSPPRSYRDLDFGMISGMFECSAEIVK